MRNTGCKGLILAKYLRFYWTIYTFYSNSHLKNDTKSQNLIVTKEELNGDE